MTGREMKLKKACLNYKINKYHIKVYKVIFMEYQTSIWEHGF